MPETVEIAQLQQLQQGSVPDMPEAAYRVEPVGELATSIASFAPPGEALLGTLRDARLKVTEPFRVSFHREESHVIAEAADVDEFGFGGNPSEALADLQRALASVSPDVVWTKRTSIS
jgi:hypothetical protein